MSQTSSDHTDALAHVDNFEACKVCTDTKLDPSCKKCVMRLKAFRIVSKDCCAASCLCAKLSPEGNAFEAMNYVRRIQRDMLMNVDKITKPSKIKAILIRKPLFCYSSVFLFILNFYHA